VTGLKYTAIVNLQLKTWCFNIFQYFQYSGHREASSELSNTRVC